MNVSYKKLATVLVACTVMLAMVTLAGCKKESESVAKDDVASEAVVKDVAAEVKEVASEVIEQTTCPIMGGKIDKNIFVEYEGKKVYFCCAGCEKPFEENPEKYVSKLPQFND